jgi:hypothetical protein
LQGLQRTQGIERMTTERSCARFVYWWNGEYEGYCELPEHHEGDHFDGLSWFDDDDNCTDHLHEDEHG